MDPRARQLFKQLLYMGKEYPQQLGGYLKFSRNLKLAFRGTSITTEEEMKQALAKGQYVIKGMLLY